MVKLKDLCTKGSSSIAQKDLADKNGVYPIYGAAGFIKNVDFYHQDKPYIAIVKDGAGVGRVMKLPANSSVIGTMQYIIPNEGVNVSYLAYALEHMNLAKYYLGAAIPHIYFKDYCNEELPAHTTKEQNNIAISLDKVTELIALRKEQYAKLDQLVKSRFIELFGDPVADSMHWGQVPLSHYLKSIRYGTSTPPSFSETGYEFIRATNIKNGKIVSSDMKFISEEEAQKIEKCKVLGGEMIIVRSGVNAGDTCIITDEHRGQYAGYDMILVFTEELHPVFANVLINTEYMDRVVKPLTRRAAQPHLNSEQVQSLPMIQVPYEQQKEFATFVEQTDKSKLAIQQSLDKLELLKKSLMQEYFG